MKIFSNILLWLMLFTELLPKCQQMNCQYRCAITRNGTRCYCGDGYETSGDGRSCSGKQEVGCNVDTQGSRWVPGGCRGQRAGGGLPALANGGLVSTAASSPVFKGVPQERAWACGAGRGKGCPSKTGARASLVTLWSSCAPGVTIYKLLGGSHPRPEWRRWGAFPTAQTGLQLVCASCSPDFATRRPWKTCSVSPPAHKVTPRLEFDKWTLPDHTA